MTATHEFVVPEVDADHTTHVSPPADGERFTPGS